MTKLSEQRAAERAKREAAIKVAQARCKHGSAWIPYGPLSWRGEASTWQCAKCGKDKALWLTEAAEADKKVAQAIAFSRVAASLGFKPAAPPAWPPPPMKLTHSYSGYILRNLDTGQICTSPSLAAFNLSCWEILDPTTYKPLGVVP
jgi:hypothetical protein